MAFKGIDFEFLRAKMDAERAMPPEALAHLKDREQFESDVPHILKDEAERAAMCKVLRVLHLAQHPDSRSDINRGVVVTLYSVPKGETPEYRNGGNVSRSLYKGSEADRLTRDQREADRPVDGIMRHLDRGAVVTVLGEEKSRPFKNRSTGRWTTVKEFHAVKIAEGELTMDEMRALRHGGAADRLADAAAAHSSAKDDKEREAVAREYLGQPPADVPASTAKGPARTDDDRVDAMLADAASWKTRPQNGR